MNLIQMTAMFAHVASRSIGEAGNRNRPNAQCLVDLTNVHTLVGLVHFGFVIDAYVPRTGLEGQHPATAGFVLDALDQAFNARWRGSMNGSIHYSDRVVQYLAMNSRSAWLKPIACLRLAELAPAMAAPWPGRSTVSNWRKLTTIQPSRLYDNVTFLVHDRL